MKMIRCICLLIMAAFIQPVFANDYQDSMSNDRPCGVIAKSCIKAGYLGKNNHEKFWKSCMKPLLLGKEVKGVTVDADIVKQCRNDKINEMKKELEEFQNVSD